MGIQRAAGWSGGPVKDQREGSEGEGKGGKRGRAQVRRGVLTLGCSGRTGEDRRGSRLSLLSPRLGDLISVLLLPQLAPTFYPN